MLKNKIKYILLVFLIILLITLSILGINCYYNERETIDSLKDTMPPKITHLTKSILGTIRYEIKNHSISDAELINISTKQDPELIKPFQKFEIKLKRNQRNVILMVGPPKGENCWFQDYSWSDDLDFNYLREGQKIPFEITAEVPLN